MGFARERKGMKKGDPPAIGKRRMRLGPNNPNSATQGRQRKATRTDLRGLRGGVAGARTGREDHGLPFDEFRQG